MKVSGFIRTAPSFPAPVIPVFSNDPAERGDSAIYLQRINGDGTISSFELASDIPDDRLVLQSHPNYPKAHVGEEAIFALEVADRDVSLRRVSKYLEYLKRFLSGDWLEKHPFLALEVANAVGDQSAKRLAAEKCFSNLSGHSRSLAEKWIVGANLDSDLTREILAQAAKDDTIGSSDERYLNFVAPEYLLEIMDRSAARGRRSRAQWVRYALNANTISEKDIISILPSVTQELHQLYERTPREQRPFLTWYRTKGKIRVSPSTFDLMRNLEEVARDTCLQDKHFMQLAKEGVVDLGRGIYTAFLFVCSMAALDKRVAEDIRNNKVSDLIPAEIVAIIAGATSRG